MRILAILLYYVLQLLPLTYRTRYWEADHQLHFCVWRQWLGRCYSVDDVVVVYDAEMVRKSIAAVERGEYTTLDEIIAELRAKGDGKEPTRPMVEQPEDWDGCDDDMLHQ
jgi:hypothetical protein